MQTPPRVLVVGDTNVDLSFRQSIPANVANSEVTMCRGGAAANAAVGLAREGVAVGLVGAVGDDEFGRFIKCDLDEHEVETFHVAVLPAMTQQVIYALDADGSLLANAVWPALFDSPLFKLTEADLDEIDLTGIKWLHLNGFCFLHPGLAEPLTGLVRNARAAGAHVSMDLNLRGTESLSTAQLRSCFEQVLPLVDDLLGSAKDEFATLFGDLAPEDVLSRLAPGAVVVYRREARGADVVWHDGLDGALLRAAVPAFTVEVQSVVGAGDAFDAGYIAARLRQMPIPDAVRRGNANAALRVSRGSIPAALEVDGLLASTEGTSEVQL